MKYKVVEVKHDWQYEETGTCDVCFGWATVDEGEIILEDETGTRHTFNTTFWSWGDYFSIEIDNVVNFSAWLQERDEPEPDKIDWGWLDNLVHEYDRTEVFGLADREDGSRRRT